MTLLVRDEEDIVESNFEFHLQQGVDFFVVTDNLSVDSTPGIIQKYVRAGVALYLHEAADDFSQHRWVTRMARIAARDHGADWIINSDADEFWLGASGSGTIKDALGLVPLDAPAIFAHRSNFIPLAWERSTNPIQQMIFRERDSQALFGGPLPPKVAHRAFTDIAIEQGNHGLMRGGTRLQPIEGPLQIFHYPLRFYKQFENKIAKGGAAYARNRELRDETGYSWRELYKLWQRGELPLYFGERVLSSEELQAQIQDGKLVVDQTAADMLRSARRVQRVRRK